MYSRAIADILFVVVLGNGLVALSGAEEIPATDPKTTSTEWRNDVANLKVVQKLNRAYARVPFSQQYDGVLDHCPLKLAWSTGPNLPPGLAWKGGVAGAFGEQIALVGGHWKPNADNPAYSFDTRDRTYSKIPSPPFAPDYTPGACDGTNLYLISGRSADAGRNVARLTRSEDGGWKWTVLPSLPAAEAEGRWVATVGLVPGKWLILCAGGRGGLENVTAIPTLPDYRLSLDQPDAKWQRIATRPGGDRVAPSSAVVNGMYYVFGGWQSDPIKASIARELRTEHRLYIVPQGGVQVRRDAYRYDLQADKWSRLRNLPVPMVGGATVVLRDRYILIMGTNETKTLRVGKSNVAHKPWLVEYWKGYNDLILCYDIQQDNYSRVGVLLYGVGTAPWIKVGPRIYGFGGEPYHGINGNTENVLQIGAINWVK